MGRGGGLVRADRKGQFGPPAGLRCGWQWASRFGRRTGRRLRLVGGVREEFEEDVERQAQEPEQDSNCEGLARASARERFKTVTRPPRPAPVWGGHKPGYTP